MYFCGERSALLNFALAIRDGLMPERFGSIRILANRPTKGTNRCTGFNVVAAFADL
jgi:hypothetical protein